MGHEKVRSLQLREALLRSEWEGGVLRQTLTDLDQHIIAVSKGLATKARREEQQISQKCIERYKHAYRRKAVKLQSSALMNRELFERDLRSLVENEMAKIKKEDLLARSCPWKRPASAGSDSSGGCDHRCRAHACGSQQDLPGGPRLTMPWDLNLATDSAEVWDPA